jgi:hypothetical protein
MAFTDGRSGRRWRRRCRGPSVRRGPGRHRSSVRTGRSSKRGLRPTAMRRAGSLTPPSGSGGGWSTSMAPTSPKRRCATTCVRASGRLAGRWPRCSCLRCLKPATDAALDERAQRAVRTQPPGESHTAAAGTRSSPPTELPVRSSQMTTTIHSGRVKETQNDHDERIRQQRSRRQDVSRQ